MSRAAAALLALSLTACPATAPVQDDKTPDNTPAPTAAADLERMQGVWTVTVHTAGAPEQRGFVDVTGDVFKIMINDVQTQPLPTNITLDPSQQPASIDLVHEGYNPGPAPEPPIRIKGRYVWQGESLTICVPLDIDGPRPAASLPCDAPDLMRMTLTRAQTIEGQLSE